MRTWPAWLTSLPPWVDWLWIASAVMLVASAILLPVLVARMPADYFVRPPRPPKHPILRILRTGLGFLLVAAGVAMLILPGQGVLTILAGLGLADFPGKRAIELWIVRRRSVARALQWLRQKVRKEPLLLATRNRTP